MIGSSFVVVLALCGAQPAPSSVTLQHCLVALINEAQVPAKEHGVLGKIPMREGQAVRAGDVLAQIEDKDAQAAKRVADSKMKQAEEEAKSDVNIRYSKASRDVAKANYDAAVEANRRLPGTFSDPDLREKWLIYVRATLEIEKAEMDQRLSKLKAEVATAELDVAVENVERRVIRSPIDGEVIEIRRHEGEWVQPGDQVVHVMRLDRLRIEGFAKASIDEAKLRGQPVTVKVPGKDVVLSGTIVYVNPKVEAGEYRVWAEVDNRGQIGQWTLRPGQEVDMTIQLLK